MPGLFWQLLGCLHLSVCLSVSLSACLSLSLSLALSLPPSLSLSPSLPTPSPRLSLQAYRCHVILPVTDHHKLGGPDAPEVCEVVEAVRGWLAGAS